MLSGTIFHKKLEALGLIIWKITHSVQNKCYKPLSKWDTPTQEEPAQGEMVSSGSLFQNS